MSGVEKLCIDDRELNNDGECTSTLCIEPERPGRVMLDIEAGGSGKYIILDAARAQQIVDHLTRVFSLEKKA